VAKRPPRPRQPLPVRMVQKVAGHESLEKEQGVPKYEKGDYIKVEFPDEATGVAEWMWVRVHSCDDAKQLVFGSLDNSPVNDASGKLKLGTELAVSFSQIRDHRKPSDFPTKN
jgi:hypothetical protein